tara:strand:- start:171 stop:326 length:156 start_codon:yes stop_codon:yes gene_type:complete
MSSCKNCGHESHCGTALRKNFATHKEEYNEIEVCKCCRCEKCDYTTKTDWG